MTIEDFIFVPGIWLGEGKTTFSASPEFLKFYTKWEITRESPLIMKAVQVVEMLGIEEHVVNQLTFTDIQPASFTVLLENIQIGRVSGTGLRNENLIAWEFRGHPTFEGFEVYEKQENGDYFFHGEYGGADEFRTIVEGLIWHKTNR